MGFSLRFQSFREDVTPDTLRHAITTFLSDRGLAIDPDSGELHRGGTSLTFDGEPTDLYITGLIGDEPPSGGIDHARLSHSECDFIYDLCVAGQWVIINLQQNPLIIVPNVAYDRAKLAEVEAVMEEESVFVTSAAELRSTLAAGFAEFVDYVHTCVEIHGDQT